MTVFDTLADVLDELAFFELLLPFFLVFLVIFAVLEKTKILGDNKRNLNTGAALIIGLITIAPHITGNRFYGFDPVEIINAALPQVSIVVVAVVALMILIGVFAHDKIYLGITAPGWIAFVSILFIIYIFGASAGWWTPNASRFLNDTFGADALAILIFLVILGVIIAYITGTDDHNEHGADLKRFGVDFQKLFGGGGGGHGGH